MTEISIAQHACRMMIERMKGPQKPPPVLEPWLGKIARYTRKNARVRGIHFELSDPDLLEIYRRSGGRCEISGIPFDLRIMAGRRNPYRPSIDRIDGRKGYTKKNVRLVLSLVNIAMNEWGLEPLIAVSKAIAEKNDDKAASLHQG